LSASKPEDLLFLQYAKQFGLQVKGHFSNFVQEDGAAVSLLEIASLPTAVGRSESPFFIAEQFSLDKSIRDGGAVDCQIRFSFSRALLVNLPGDDFFARSLSRR
jgi:hypothetical protein